MAQDQRRALSRGAWLCFLDESGASLTPPTRRTWAPRGHTPVLRHRMRAAGASRWPRCAATGPTGPDACLAFHLSEDAYDTVQLIPVVQALRRLLGGEAPVIVVWDNLPAHTSLAMRAWVADQHAWLQVEYLPVYAPDLNPVEGPVGQPEGRGAANRACRSLAELAAAAEQGIGRVRGEPELLLSFLHQAALSL